MEKGRPLYLLLHYEAGHWDFAKGHIEKGEKTEDTVRRETKEEAGINDLRFMPGFKETIRYWMRPRTRAKPRSRTSTLLDRSSTELCSGAGLGAGLVQYRSAASGTGPRKTKNEVASQTVKSNPKGVLKFVVFYLAQTKTSRVVLSFEHKGYVWLPYEDAIKKATYSNAKIYSRRQTDF
jgi:hypothetical protein